MLGTRVRPRGLRLRVRVRRTHGGRRGIPGAGASREDAASLLSEEDPIVVRLPAA